jgi:hypothetical protein
MASPTPTRGHQRFAAQRRVFERGALAAFAVLAGVILTLSVVATAQAATFDPLNVVSYDSFRASSSMTTSDIQAFLDAQTGPLGSLVTTDYANIRKPASQIIWEAARAWNLNPKLVLATLQKEQSLLTTSNSSNKTRLARAMGCGIYPGSPNTYPGFGNQVWNGTRKLSTYELPGTAGGQLPGGWKPGTTMRVTLSSDHTKKITIVPANASTFALYTYTPYYPQKLVWDVWVRFFGDPQTPARMQPVYRFVNRYDGSYLYTASEGERYRIIKRYPKKWSANGIAFTCDASSTIDVLPFYRMSNVKTHALVFTASNATRLALLKTKRWVVDRVVCTVAATSTDGVPVYRITSRATGATMFTQSYRSAYLLTHGRAPRFRYWGVSFRLGRASEPATPTP